jgi:hypothetical protein
MIASAREHIVAASALAATNTLSMFATAATTDRCSSCKKSLASEICSTGDLWSE